MHKRHRPCLEKNVAKSSAVCSSGTSEAGSPRTLRNVDHRYFISYPCSPQSWLASARCPSFHTAHVVDATCHARRVCRRQLQPARTRHRSLQHSASNYGVLGLARRWTFTTGQCLSSSWVVTVRYSWTISSTVALLSASRSPPPYEHNDFTFALTCLSSVSLVGIVGGGDQACEFEAGRTMIRFSCCRSSALKWDLRQSPPTFCFLIRLHDDFALSPTAL